MALNGISTLPTKEERLLAKLELAQEKRLAQNHPRPYYNIEFLPTQYDGNNILNNLNEDGLFIGRPWTDVAPIFVNPEFTLGSAVSIVTQSPFIGGGNSYSMLSSVDSYINIPASNDWVVGTGDFTIEWFSYQTDLTQYQRIFTIGDYPTTSFGVSIEDGVFYYWANTSVIFSGPTSTINTWIHWAVVRLSGNTYVYKDGVLQGLPFTDTNNITDNTTNLIIGNTNTYDTNTALVGYITNFRFVNGLAVYSGDFTVPTDDLTATAIANPYGGTNTNAIPSGVTKLLLVP